ncbi:hypothetical protein CDL15_Pgr028709 [Punica granatum]|uniref:Uncharacterized protein n=1 Tax=Punica granatum TaxID=22663 RepID=A0A218VYA7_PUNGR|nr:hypothetical protein CDL15_Pgr028709 [Punica granatum]PKI38393.1 hypothetical protein CRG98_041219 [Punica granatum]
MVRLIAVLTVLTLLFIFTSSISARSGSIADHHGVHHHHRGRNHATSRLHRSSWHKKKPWTNHGRREGHSPRKHFGNGVPKHPLQVLKLPL